MCKCLSSACKPLLTVIGAFASAWGATLQVLNAILKRFEPVLILADCIQVSDSRCTTCMLETYLCTLLCGSLRHHAVLCHAAGDCDFLLLDLRSAVL